MGNLAIFSTHDLPNHQIHVKPYQYFLLYCSAWLLYMYVEYTCIIIFTLLPQGNAEFKRGEYELAVESYSRAMELDPLSAVMPANRAMAYLKLKRSETVHVCMATYLSPSLSPRLPLSDSLSLSPSSLLAYTIVYAFRLQISLVGEGVGCGCGWVKVTILG